MSNCQSSRSSLPPSQRFPKVSIGIMADKTPTMGYANKKDDETLRFSNKIAASSQEKIVEENIGLGTTTSSAENDTQAKGNVSPWVSTRFIYSEAPNPQTSCFHAKASVLQSDDGLHKKLDNVTCGMKKEKSGDFEKIKEVASAATPEVHPVHKRSAEDPIKEDRSEALRMKLWEALGAAFPQSKKISSPPLVNGNAKVSNSETYKDEQAQEVLKPRQETDTIETDSENPNTTLPKVDPRQSMRRPFTRSLARKKEPGKTLPKLQHQKNNAKKYLSSSKAEKQNPPEEKNIFSFNKGVKQKENPVFAANGQTPLSAQKNHETRSARVEPRKISFTSKSVSLESLQSGKSLQSNAKEQTLPPLKNEANKTSTMQGIRTFHCEMEEQSRPSSSSDSGNTVHSKTNHLEDLSNSLLPNRSETRELDDPPVQRECQGSQHGSFAKKEDPHVKARCPKLVKGVASLHHFCSPTFAENIAPSLETNSIDNSCHSPMLSGEKVQPRILRSPLNPTSCSSESAAYPETSDDIRDSQVSPTGESPPFVKRKVEEKYSASQVQPSSSESLGTDEIIVKDLRKMGTRNSNASYHNKSPITLHHGKRVRRLEDIEVRLDPCSASPFNYETEEASGSHCFTDQCPQDSLGRAITQLAVVLESFKAKIRSHTGKKSSEILSSVGDSIRLRLQEIESLIQADVEKFMSLGKSKRKRLESTFLEQQEKLKSIHDKFKKEVNQHLLDCRSTLKDLETYQKELKGSVEKQKAAHRKLILQVEGAMKDQLADAETNIAAVHKAAKKKMEGMKHALREWLADDGTLN